MPITEVASTGTQQNSQGRVLIVGAGVSGLTTALCLRQEGFEVTIAAEKFAPQVTSVVAGALWEWPPAVCGHHQDQASLNRSKAWCKTSYDAFSDLSLNSSTGVFMRMVTFYFRQRVEEDTRQFQKMNELKDKVREFTHDPALIAENGINPQSGARDAYAHLTPLVDTDTYMVWLLGEVRRAGCRVVQQRFTGALRDQEQTLKKSFQADAIVNCAGLGSAELANDPMYPLRGALIRVMNDGKRFPRITQAHCVSHEGDPNETGFIFILPRGNDRLILGGLAEANQWDLGIGLDNYEPIQKMFQRCIDFLPILKNAELDQAEPVRVGLRPFRRQNVRLDLEAGTNIIHNYGHGGSGVTFSWGCAQEVVGMVQRLLSTNEKENQPVFPSKP